jgi:hypothetical protein
VRAVITKRDIKELNMFTAIPVLYLPGRLSLSELTVTIGCYIVRGLVLRHLPTAVYDYVEESCSRRLEIDGFNDHSIY